MNTRFHSLFSWVVRESNDSFLVHRMREYVKTLDEQYPSTMCTCDPLCPVHRHAERDMSKFTEENYRIALNFIMSMEDHIERMGRTDNFWKGRANWLRIMKKDIGILEVKK